jgi:arylsulfatase A-like enzyme
MKRGPVLIVLATVAVALGVGLFFALREEQSRPNIVVIVIDTLRADHLPLYGYPHATAPFLSELAQDGIVCDRAYSTSSWTAPGMLAAGRARQTDPTITLNAIPDEAVTLPEILQRAGYRTFGVADNLNICAAEGFDQGFDAFQSYNYRGAAAVNAQVVDWTTEILQPESPYFLYVHYMDPHKPYGHRQPWSSQLGATGTADISAYDSEIRHVDEHIRTLFETMGWKDNTIVVVTSDHGEEFGDHGEFGHGHNLYDETLQVPLLVYPASALGRNGGRVRESVSLIDLLPTLREIAGARPAEHEEGLSLLGALRGESRSLEERGEIFAHLQRTRLEYRNGEELVSRAAISGTRKYLLTLPEVREELYDLIDDPGETRNLFSAHPGPASELRRALENFEQTCERYPGVSKQIQLDQEQLEKLRSLGYVN